MIRTHDTDEAQAARSERAREILFRLFNRAATRSMRPWQLAFYGTQHTLCHASGDGALSYRPDAFQLGVLEGILAEHEPPEREVFEV